jgi:glyoxylase-like metal-dependent hydrolase (beta-lactamase superfamily II)
MNHIFRIEFGTFKLDGGAMFGSVPKTLWSRLIDVDELNRIPLAARGLLVKQNDKLILIDVGMGEKWDAKSREIFAIKNSSFKDLNFNPDSVTDILLTHLHFDHAGGISYYDGDNLIPTYKNAKVYLQESNYLVAKNPSLREKASYLKDNWSIIEQMPNQFLNGNLEVFDGIKVHQINGHTQGQQWIEIDADNKKWLFATDLVPTSRHLPVPYVMGYDLCAKTALEEKQKFLEYAISTNAIVVFQHDSDTPAATIKINDKGHYSVDQKIDLHAWS